jgi:thiopurine S-methyltransferase
LDAAFWHERWHKDQIGFHQTSVARQLEKYWPCLEIAPTSHVFVPLCGKSLDLLWLSQRVDQVTGVELSNVAVEALHLENGIAARRRSGNDAECFVSASLRVFRADFFWLTRATLGPVDAVYDRAALIAWPQELRAPYVERLSELTGPGTRTLLITIEYPPHETQGPPFSVSAGDVERLYGAHHHLTLLGRDDILAQDPRMQARGVTDLHEACYLLNRK